MPPEQYVQWVHQEIRGRHQLWSENEIQTLYFGGGTPSLISPELIVSIYRELANVGFRFLPESEITIEINPATIDESKLAIYREAGVNRFSVGAQSFNDELLKTCGRRHSAQDTRNTLALLQKYNLNYSFDLLFALPGQTLTDLERDLEEVISFAPPHLSAYCLTVPEGHPMNRGRAPEAEQIDMFHLIESNLAKVQLLKYEISNFARPGFESKHNQVYWSDQNFWGLGLSSHSYWQNGGSHGIRFWNSKNFSEYGDQVRVNPLLKWTDLPSTQWEALTLHESLTDFCHMFLRTQRGLSKNALHKKYGNEISQAVENRLHRLCLDGLLEFSQGSYRLTPKGELISNKVFEELTFLASDDFRGTLTASLSGPYCAV